MLESTPVMAPYVWYVLVFAILATFVGLAIIYVLASWLNPWTGTKNILVWSSNYGYDANAIRLITPGISDFLRYLQFAFFIGSLNLNYPGFFRPILATASWSCLLFHFNFVSDSNDGFYDNLYIYNGAYGMSKMARIVQLVEDKDIWPSFIIWLLIVTGIVLVLFAIVYLLTTKWHRPVLSLGQSDGFKIEWRRGFLFLGGMVLRLFLMLFALPLLTTSFFQMLIVKSSPVVSDVFAMLLIILWVSSAGWIIYKMNLMMKTIMDFSEDLPTLLVYGPLFNIFKDTHIMYFAIELMVVFFQGLTFGALQKSGIAQIALLAVIEIFRFATLVYFKPYENGTSMTMVSCLFSAVRIIEIFLLIPFITSLGTDSTVRGWVAYIILIIHAVILLLFIVHIAQVLFELFARLGGAGKDEEVKEEGRLMTYNTAYGLKQLHIGEDTDKNLIAPQSPTEVTIDNGYRRPKSQYAGNKQPNSALVRDNAFEDVFVASPTSEQQLSPNGGVTGPQTAGTSTLSSANYYRRPRRRQSSHDWGEPSEGHVVGGAATAVAAAAAAAAGGAQPQSPGTTIRTATTSPTLINTKTDYAVREADLYITKRTTNSLYDDGVDGEDDYSRRDSESVNPLIHRESMSYSPIKEKLLDSNQALLGEHTNNTSNSSGQKSGLYGSVKGIMDKVGGRLRDTIAHPNQRRASEEIPSGKGFEVMNRQPIRPYRAVAGTNSILASASAIDGEDKKEGTSKAIKSKDEEDPGFIFHLPSSVGAGGPGVPSRLRVVTDPINTITPTPRLISPIYRNPSAIPRRSLSRQSERSESSSVYQSISEEDNSPANDKSTTQLRPPRPPM